MPNYNHLSSEIFTAEDFCTLEECAAFVSQAEIAGFGEAPIDTAFGVQMVKDIRNNERVILDDPRLALQLWKRIGDYIPHTLAGYRAVGVNERFRFYRYDPGQIFRWHRDGYFARENGERSRLTFMIYLNDDFEGGATHFEDLSVTPATGMALFFVHHLLHEGCEVTSGRKYVLRTDVMYAG